MTRLIQQLAQPIGASRMLLCWPMRKFLIHNSWKKNQHILQGKNLPISCTQLATTLHVVGSENFTVALTRSFSRLNGILITLYNADQAGTRALNTFYHKAGGTAAITKLNDSITLSMQLGAKRMPEYPISSCSEFVYHLQSLLGILHGESSFNITSRGFHDNSFIMGYNMEKLSGSGAEYSGLNSKNNLLTLDVKGATAATQCYVTLIYSSIVNIRSSGTEVLE